MASGSPSGEPEEQPDLALELEAERAATEQWRRVALQRSTEYAELRRRPLVRATLAAERRTERARAHAMTTARTLQGAAAEASLRVSALADRLRRSGRGHVRAASPAGAEEAPAVERSVVLVVVGSPPPSSLDEMPDGVTVVSVPTEADAGPNLALAVTAHRPELVGILLASSEPADPSWLARLVAAIQGPVMVAAPLLIHPCRPLSEATPHDGKVRAAGLALDVDGAGVPIATSIAAGAEASSVNEVTEVDAASSAALLVDAHAYEAVGGLRAGSDLEAATVELCARVRAQGGGIAVVPSAVVVDHRAVRSRRELLAPVDPRSKGWAEVVERSGPLLHRLALPASSRNRLRLTITVAAPSAKVARRWGDWHMATALADSLRRRGHVVLVQTADHGDDLAGRSSDVHVVLRGVHHVRRTQGQQHVLWVISHPEHIEARELDAADLVLVASHRYAEHLRKHTSTPVEVLLQATDPHRFRPVPPDPAHRHDVTIVAKTRDAPRPVVADALAAGLRPAVYGGGWKGLVDADLIVAEHIDNELLPVVYSSAGVVLNDHWRTMQTWGFVSNRLFDVLACGTPVISDPVPGLAELFDGAVLEYRDVDDLRTLVEAVLGDPTGARERAAKGREIVLAEHTFDHRADALLRALDRYT